MLVSSCHSVKKGVLIFLRGENMFGGCLTVCGVRILIWELFFAIKERIIAVRIGVAYVCESDLSCIEWLFMVRML